MGYYVETRADGLPWTRGGCNERRDGAFVPYTTKAAAKEAVRARREDRNVFDDPMWAAAEYRIVRHRGKGKKRVRLTHARVRLNPANGDVHLRTTFRTLKEVLTAASLHCYDSIDREKAKKGLKGQDAVESVQMVDYNEGMLRFIKGIDDLMDHDLRSYLYEDPMERPRRSKHERLREVRESQRERRLFDEVLTEMWAEASARNSAKETSG